jgi:hypothetical protein
MKHNNKLNHEWEDRLRPYGLALRQIKEQAVQAIPGLPNEFRSIQSHQFDKNIDPWEVRAPDVLSEEDFERFHEVPSRHYDRDIPHWAFSDISIRILLLCAYPNLTENEQERKNAAKMCSIIYRYFRLCEPLALLAVDFETTEKGIKQRLIRIRKIAKKLGL